MTADEVWTYTPAAERWLERHNGHRTWVGAADRGNGSLVMRLDCECGQVWNYRPPIISRREWARLLVWALIVVLFVGFVVAGLRYSQHRTDECKARGGELVKTSSGSKCLDVDELP